MTIKEVAPNLFRGPRPNSYRELQAKGIDVVVDLESGISAQFSDSEYGQENPSDFGIAKLSWPLSNWEVPSVHRLALIANLIQIQLWSQKRVYVHCRWGKDRTGIVIAAWRLRYCIGTLESAKKEMFENGFRKWFYFLWVRQLKKLQRI